METKKVTEEMYIKLKAKLPDEAITQHPTKTYLSSIKAIYVTERLNDVFGCGSWQIKAEKISETANGMVVIKTTLTIPEYNISYESFGGNDNGGENNKNFDLGDAYKGATTDGITKIGSYLGIGIEVFKGKYKSNDQNHSDNKNEPEKKWLNRFAKDGTSILPEYLTILKEAKKKGLSAEDLKKYYKISKNVESYLKSDFEKN
jgi:hypothetical protein